MSKDHADTDVNDALVRLTIKLTRMG